MRRIDENRAKKYIRKHNLYKRWLSVVVVLALLTGTLTMYLLREPATAVTEQAAVEDVGMVIDSEALGISSETESVTETVSDVSDSTEAEVSETTLDTASEETVAETTDSVSEETTSETEATEEVSGGDTDSSDENADSTAAVSETADSSTEVSDSTSTSSEVTNESDESTEVSEGDSSLLSESTTDSSEINSSSDIASSGISSDLLADSSTEASSDSSTEASSDSSTEASSDSSASASSGLSSEEAVSGIIFTAKFQLTDGSSIASVADEELTIEENMNLTESPKSLEGFDYVRALINDTIVIAITAVTDENGAISYTYTDDEDNTVAVTEDTTVIFEYKKSGTEESVKTEYTYEDDNVSITATIKKAEAIPDGAELVVTQITADTTGYNYDAYMDALNNNEETNAEESGEEVSDTYTDENTLMYDIAFMYDGTEVEPENDSVSISFEFKNKQLSSELDAESAEDVSVIHLPIKDEVKESSEITTTSEATEITADDIEVKTLTEATTEITEEGEKVEFSEDSFSVFVFASGTTQSNTWNGSKQITLRDFSSISSLFYYSIVANELTSYGHIEGNVRTGTYYTDTNGSVFNNGNDRITQNPITEIDVVKTVVNGSDGTFTFRFYDESGNTVGSEFTIKTSGLTGTKKILNTDSTYSDIFTALNAGTVLYVYELDNSGNPVADGDSAGDYTVSYSYSDILGYDSSEIANDYESNYIGEFESLTGSLLEVGNNFFGTNKNFVGESFGTLSGKPSNYYYFGSDADFCVQNVTSGMFTYVEGLKATIASDLENAKDVSVALAEAMNYETGSDTTENLVNVINLVSTTGVLSTDLSAANFASPYISGLLSSDQYLLINIAVDESKYSSYSIDGQSLNFDNKNPQNGYTDLASHIIYNFVNSSRNASYTGTVKITSWSDGLLLAPAATVDQTGAYFQGEIIGNIVYHGNGNELHKKTIVSEKAVTVNVYNTAEGGITVYKQIDGSPAGSSYDGKFNFIIEQYKGSGNWSDITSSVCSGGLTNTYDCATGLSTVSIPLPSLSKNKTTYFRIKEDSSTTVKGIDNDEDYIYIAVVTDSSGDVSSIRYYKVDGDYKYLYSPDYSINKSGATEVTVSDVAFNNTSSTTEITVTKTWSGGDKWAYVYAYVCGRANSTDINGVVVQLSEANNWTVTVEDLPAYTNSGTPIIYRVVEIGQIVNSIDEIEYDSDGKPSNLLYDENVAGTSSDEYEGYNASYSTDLSDDEIATAAGTTIDKVTGPERVGAVGETSGTVTITNTYNYSNITLSLFK
ncbi:MAG: Cna B-type domain-containing protein, partial [Butyrivibrio sp.]|nr:Cna B-type domain-containing protein [Butyrivibrio sp.]